MPPTRSHSYHTENWHFADPFGIVYWRYRYLWRLYNTSYAWQHLTSGVWQLVGIIWNNPTMAVGLFVMTTIINALKYMFKFHIGLKLRPPVSCWPIHPVLCEHTKREHRSVDALIYFTWCVCDGDIRWPYRAVNKYAWLLTSLALTILY